MMIRQATVTDAKAIVAIYDYYVINTAITFEYETPTVKEMAERIETISAHYPFIVAIEDERIVGYAYAKALSPRAAYQWSVETSIYVNRHSKGHGIGRHLYEELERQLKAQGIISLYACIAYGDDQYVTPASVTFHEKLGYSIVGHFHQCGLKFDHWYDVIWMEKKL